MIACRSRRVLSIILVLGGLGTSARSQDLPPPHSPFLGYVYRYADVMLEHGRDTYGPQETGLLLSALDRQNLAPLTTRPAPPAGIRREDRVGPPWQALVGSNPQLDQNLLRVLYTLSELSFSSKYRDAADNALKWFLENTASPVTHLLPWGEHMSWNVLTDEAMPKHEKAVHEFARPWVLWERCFALAPEPSARYALGLWEHQIADHETGAFDRHALYWRHGPSDGMDYPRHAGFYIRTWGEAYAHTRDEVFLRAIETLLNRYENKRHPETGLIEDRTNRPNVTPSQTLSLAIDCDAAARKVPSPLAERLKSFVTREDELFCSMPHDLRREKGFLMSLDKATGSPGQDYSPLWAAEYGGGTTGGIAMMCVSRYENGGRLEYRDLITAAAEAYNGVLPGEDLDAWPQTFGHVISLYLSAWRITADEKYLERAQKLGMLAIERFWEDKPLPRASLKTGHYETITGADTLALALIDLHLSILHITAVRAPSNTIDR